MTLNTLLLLLVSFLILSLTPTNSANVVIHRKHSGSQNFVLFDALVFLHALQSVMAEYTWADHCGNYLYTGRNGDICNIR